MSYVQHLCRHHDYPVTHICLCPRTRDHVQLADIYHLPIDNDEPLFELTPDGEMR